MDPKAKEIKKFKTIKQGMALVRQGLQKLQWSIVKLDENVFVIGKGEMCLYVKEIIDEALRNDNKEEQTELRSSLPDDNVSPLSGELLQEKTASGDKPGPEGTSAKDNKKGSEST